MNRGEIFTFMLVPDMVKLISEQLKVFTSTTRLPVLTRHIMRSFVCKHFNPNLLRVVFEFWTPPPWRFLSFRVCIVWARFREQFWSRNGAVNFCFLNSQNVRLVKIKECQQFKFFASKAIDVYANKFQSTNKVIFTCAKWRRPCLLFFRQGIKSILIF